MINWYILFFISLNTDAQSPVTFFDLMNNTSIPDSVNSGRGWNSSGTFPQSTNFTMHFGRSASSSNGLEREIQRFNVGSRSFSRLNGGLGEPFNKITVNRHPGMTGDTINTFYEFTASSGNNLYLTSEYIPNLEDIINSNVVNRGSDNLFSNTPSTQANIERLDLINSNGIRVVDGILQGFLLNERGGNDNFKVAAITAINGTQTVTALGNLLTVSSSSWGQVGPTISTRVMSRRLGADPNLRPKQDVTAQPVSGIYISFSDLGIPNGTIIYGLSLFPNDVNSSMNLISLNNVPTNTNQSTDGGLDLMAGMGYFVENTLLPAIEWDFQLKKVNEQIWLKWNNVFSENTKGFIVERSHDGNHFIPIAQKTISGNASYIEHIDQMANNHKTYYRIKAMHQDESYLYSNTLFLNGSTSAEAKIYPNPFTQYINLEIFSPLNQKSNISWMNQSGKMIKQESIWLNRGNNLLKLEPPPDLPVGKIYFRMMMQDGTSKTIQVIKN